MNRQNKLWEKIILNSCYGLPKPDSSFGFFDPVKAELIQLSIDAYWTNSDRREKIKKILEDDAKENNTITPN